MHPKHAVIAVAAMPVLLVTLAGLASRARARPVLPRHEITEPALDVDIVGDVDGTAPAPRKVLQDTIWIATWDFDVGAACDLSGWERRDGHVANDGVHDWDLDPSFDATGGISGLAAALGYENDLCCDAPNGYRNDWYQAIRIEYAGGAAGAPIDISFDYMVDSEGGFDFLQVEVDEDCAAFERVDWSADPSSPAAAFRTLLFSNSGDVTAGDAVMQLTLTDFGPGTHCVYVAFFSDGAFSPCDGLQETRTGKALVVDNIVVRDANGTRSEDFEDGALDIGTFANIADLTPFGPTDPGRDGSWARVYAHITDNDVCTENTTCAILWTDDTTPTIANDPSMAFAPGGYVVRNWLDDRILSPWVSLASTAGPARTIVQFRRFPGNFFSSARIVQNWSVRAKVPKDDGQGGTVECISRWGHAFQWNSLSHFAWITPTAPRNPPNSGYDASSNFDPSASAIQVRHRVFDWQFIVGGAPPPNPWIPGPGPFIDRTRIGRVLLTGPVIDEGIDARSQAQDAFPTELHPGVTLGTGEHHRPTTNRFGTTAFSRGSELGINGTSANLITGDSITIEVQDVRGAGGIAGVEFYAAIVDGPHAGLAPPPHTVGSSGFFVVTADSARVAAGTVAEGFFFVDVADDYFVGGDVLHYVWLAEDALGGTTSLPFGLTGVPSSVEAAQHATRGMFEVSFLPAIDWSPDYLAAVGAQNHVDPTSDPVFLDESAQRNCILYVNRVNTRRRSGNLNRTSFIWTLDRLGYRGAYDVYDHTGMGNTNNHLGGRATVQQAQGYNLIVYDAGNAAPTGTLVPDGSDIDSQKVDQAGWFQAWLAQAFVSEAGFTTLWILGTDVLQEKPTNLLYTSDMQVNLSADGQALNVNPDCVGMTSFTFDVGSGSNDVNFAVGPRAWYSLSGGCPTVRTYDALGAGGFGVEVYRYRDPFFGTLGDAAIVMNSSPTNNWNTIFQSHPWSDIHFPFSTPADPESPSPPFPAVDLLQRILAGVIPTACLDGLVPPDHTSTPEVVPPQRTLLHANAPNPFNPTTTIRFDLAQTGRVTLRIYDVAGRLVRTLVNVRLDAARHVYVWDGLDADHQRASSGVYVYRLDAPDFVAQKKMLLLK